jgi:hypothetical protein
MNSFSGSLQEFVERRSPSQTVGVPNGTVDVPGVLTVGGTSAVRAEVMPVANGDSLSRIQAAIDSAATTGGGSVSLFNAGYPFVVSGPVILKSNICLEMNGATIKLQNGANTSVIQSDNFLSLSGTNSGAGISNFSIRNGVIDGNKANNSSPPSNEGHGVAIFGRDFYIDSLEITNSSRRGLHTEYGDGSVGVSPFNGRVNNLLVNTSGEEGWYNAVSDVQSSNINIRSAGVSANNTYDAIYVTSTASIRCSNVNIWTGGGTEQRHRYGVNLQSGKNTLFGVHIETSATAGMLLAGESNTVSGVHIYNTVGSRSVIITANRNFLQIHTTPGSFNTDVVGVQVGASGLTVSRSVINIMTRDHFAGVVDMTYTAGSNEIRINGEQASGTLIIGSPLLTDRIYSELSVLGKIFGGGAAGAVAIGNACSALSIYATAIGNSATASQQTAVSLGNNTLASTYNTLATGGRSSAGLYGMRAHASGMFSIVGDAQMIDLLWFGQTTDGNAKELFLDNVSTRAAPPDNTSWFFTLRISGRRTNASAAYSAEYSGIFKRDSGVGTVSLVELSSPVIRPASPPAGWSTSVSASTSHGALEMFVTGASGQNINWVARMHAEQIRG